MKHKKPHNNKMYQAKRYKTLRLLGKCVQCGKPSNGKRLCKKHAEANRVWWAKYRENFRRVVLGL